MAREKHQVAIPGAYFLAMAVKEYANYVVALVREFVQNGRDAGATAVRLNCEDGQLTVTNNGKTMPLDICKTAFLTMGGTHKDDGAVGGFGKAKELLCFSWEMWELVSDTYRIDGEHNVYTVTENLPHQDGVTTTIQLDEKTEMDDWRIKSFLRQCEMPGTEVYWQGEAVECKLTKGSPIREFSFGTLYKKETEGTTNHLVVRSNGVKMFHQWTSIDGCELILELDSNAREHLTSNRDGLKESPKQELQEYLNELAANELSALADKRGESFTAYRGQGHTRSFELTESDKEAVVQATHSLRESSLERLVEDVAEGHKVMTANGPKYSWDKDEETFEEPATDRPDVLVHAKQGEIPSEYNPKSWSRKTEAIVAMWHRIIRQILVDANARCVFGVGLVIDTESNQTKAEFVKHDGVPYFLINPALIKNDKLSGTVAKWFLVQELKQSGIHEVTHFAGEDSHGEYFNATRDLIESLTWHNEKAYRAFAKLTKVKFKI